MKILIYGLNFSPELTGIGKYTGEMTQWLVERGHEVRVVAAPPYYPEWRVHKGYRAWEYRQERSVGLTVTRCPVWVPRKVSSVKRILHLTSFAISSFPVVLGLAKWRPDIVWTVEPTLLTSPAALITAKLSGAKTWLHIQDYEIDAAFSMGILRGRLRQSWIFGFERWLIRFFDRVSSISDRMVELAQQKGVPSERLLHFRNWVDLQGISPLAAPQSYRAELGISPESVVVLYSGNMGAKQGLEILADAAMKLKNEAGIEFVFCGDGASKADLIQRCEGLSNVHFIPLQPKHRLNDLLGTADIHVLPQRADAADLVLPSKLTGMLASGKPVIVTAHPNTELARIVQQAGAGTIIPPEDGSALASAISSLSRQPSLREEAGLSGRRFAEKHLDASAVLAKFELELQSLLDSPAHDGQLAPPK